MSEFWKPIEKTSGLYEISNKGRVRSWNQRGHNRSSKRKTPRYLKTAPDNVGYESFSIVQNGSWKTKRVHRELAKCFIKNPNKYKYVLHKNDIKTDNRVENLYWGSPKDNSIDSFNNGNSPRGEKCSWSALTKKEVIEIKELLYKGELSQTQIAQVYGVARTTINNISNNYTWKHVECGTPEDYTTVLIDENGNEIEEPNPITGKQIDEMGEYYESD